MHSNQKQVNSTRNSTSTKGKTGGQRRSQVDKGNMADSMVDNDDQYVTYSDSDTSLFKEQHESKLKKTKRQKQSEKRKRLSTGESTGENLE